MKSIRIYSPDDGGYPRGAEHIEQLGGTWFRLHIPSSKDSHIMVEAVNDSESVQQLTLELSHDPREDKESSKPHYYYCGPSGKWRKVYLAEGTPRLAIPLEQGVTRIAGIPWYTYAEYISYVEGLNDPRVRKEVVCTDEDGEFLIYRLTVTNPGGVKDKMRICFGRAHHTNESSGYYMAQGIIEWLLSGDPAANLDHTEWSFFLCPDPKAIYYHYTYEEIAGEMYDTGKTMLESYDDALRAGKYHIILIEHMWNNEHGGLMRRTTIPNLEFEAYEYNDPMSEDSTDKLIFPDLTPVSQVWKDYTAFWPHWYEYGSDHYFHRNGKFWDWKMPGSLMMINEIIFFGKDSGDDLIGNVKRQGKEWARATIQVYLRFQQRHRFWTAEHPMGNVYIEGAVMLPVPEHILLERLQFWSGGAARKINSAGGPMMIFGKQYDHGLGMQSGDQAVFTIPVGTNGFKANVAVDDSSAADGLAFVVLVDGVEIWRSQPMKRYESRMAHVKLPGKGKLTLAVEGADNGLGNWGGAKFIINDPDM